MSLAFDPGRLRRVVVEPRLWWRVYPKPYGALGFNASGAGNARFSPLRDTSGAIIPTLYAGSTPAVALMETVLHDAPWPSDGFILQLPRYSAENRRIVGFLNTDGLVLADFSSLGLRRLGIKKSAIIETDKTHYPVSRAVARRVYEQCLDVQGIQWRSRQDDGAHVVVLFETRMMPGLLTVRHGAEHIQDEPHLSAILELLEVLGAGLLQES